MRLADLGWDETFAARFAALDSRAAVEPARVAIEFNHIYRVYVEGGEFDATISGQIGRAHV